MYIFHFFDKIFTKKFGITQKLYIFAIPFGNEG